VHCPKTLEETHERLDVLAFNPRGLILGVHEYSVQSIEVLVDLREEVFVHLDASQFVSWWKSPLIEDGAETSTHVLMIPPAFIGKAQAIEK
jgi:hypothetical protein